MSRTNLIALVLVLALASCSPSADWSIGSLEQKLPLEVESWGPENSTFKMAATCHRKNQNEFGIVAVFTTRPPPPAKGYDSVWYIRVQGDPTAADYGKRIGKVIPVDSPGRVDHVDCAEDDADSIYLAWDRYNADLRWARYNGGSAIGPKHVVSSGCEIGSNRRPRIAYHDGKVTVLYHGYDYLHTTSSCGFCWDTFRTDGTLVHHDFFWFGAGMSHRNYDLEWADGNYVVAVKWRSDGEEPDGNGGTWQPCRYSTIRIDADGQPFRDGVDIPWIDLHARACTDIDDPTFPSGAHLVYSPGAWNLYKHLIVQTDRETYWTDSAGAALGRELAYTATPFAHFPACEYWAQTFKIAHTFVEDTAGAQTLHAHWETFQAPPRDVGGVAPGYYPEACSSRPQVHANSRILVALRMIGDDTRVHWALGVQH